LPIGFVSQNALGSSTPEFRTAVCWPNPQDSWPVILSLPCAPRKRESSSVDPRNPCHGRFPGSRSKVKLGPFGAFLDALIRRRLDNALRRFATTHDSPTETQIQLRTSTLLSREYPLSYTLCPAYHFAATFSAFLESVTGRIDSTRKSRTNGKAVRRACCPVRGNGPPPLC
jgi:hypothetical protein